MNTSNSISLRVTAPVAYVMTVFRYNEYPIPRDTLRDSSAIRDKSEIDFPPPHFNSRNSSCAAIAARRGKSRGRRSLPRYAYLAGVIFYAERGFAIDALTLTTSQGVRKRPYRAGRRQVCAWIRARGGLPAGLPATSNPPAIFLPPSPSPPSLSLSPSLPVTPSVSRFYTGVTSFVLYARREPRGMPVARETPD